MFVEIHSLHTYIGALLNRGQEGEAKTLLVGGRLRTMISSQCRKRHWRKADGEFAIANIQGAEESVRSRNVIPELVMKNIREEGHCTPETADAVETQLNVQIYGNEGAQERHRQCLLMGLPEINFIRAKAGEVCNTHPGDPNAAAGAIEKMFNPKTEEGRNFQTMLRAVPLRGGLTAAMFGRMNTADPDANMEGAISVNHAFTIHAEEPTHDFFTAIDDLSQGRSTAMLGYTELNSGIYYSYVAVDVKQHVANTQACKPEDWRKADRELTAQTVRHLVHLIATVSPGAKKGSTAPFGIADLMLAEIGTGQPRNLANAYLNPCRPNLEDAFQALTDQMEGEDRMMGNQRSRMFASTHNPKIPWGQQTSLHNLAEWVAEAIRKGNTAPGYRNPIT